MLLDLIDLERLRRGIIYALFLLLCLFFQNAVLSNLEILNIKLLIVPFAVCAVGFFENGVWGFVFGIFMGFFTDMSMDSGFFIFTFLLPILGFLSGCLTMFFVERKFLSFFIIAAISHLMMTVGQMITVVAAVSTKLSSFLYVGALQWGLSLILIPPTYVVVRFIAKMKLTK